MHRIILLATYIHTCKEEGYLEFSTVDCSYPPFLWPTIIFHMVDTIMFPLFCNCSEATRTERAGKIKVTVVSGIFNCNIQN